MRSLKIAVLFSIVALISGCIVSSVQPLYTDEKNDTIYDPGLIGSWSWADKDNKETVTFTQQSTDKVYAITYTSDSATAKFDGRLVQIGSSKYLDVYPQEQDTDTGYFKNGLYKLLAITPMHFFVQVKVEGDILSIAILDLDKVKTLFDKKGVRIAHTTRDGRIILIANSPQLQSFIAMYANQMMSDPGEYHRLKNQ